MIGRGREIWKYMNKEREVKREMKKREREGERSGEGDEQREGDGSMVHITHFFTRNHLFYSNRPRVLHF